MKGKTKHKTTKLKTKKPSKQFKIYMNKAIKICCKDLSLDPRCIQRKVHS